MSGLARRNGAWKVGSLVAVGAVAFLFAAIFDWRNPVHKSFDATVVLLQRVPSGNGLRDIGGKQAIPALDACRVIVREDTGRESAFLVPEGQFLNLHEGQRVQVHYQMGRFVTGAGEVTVKPLLR